MKKIIPALFALLISLTLMAQDGDKGDKKSNEILEKFTKITKAYKNFRAEFTYKMQNTEADIDEASDGILLVEGNKYRLNIAGQTVICDGETVWTYIADADEVQINTLSDADESISPNKLLFSYNKDYRSKFIKEDFLYGTDVYILDLTPIEGKSYYKVRLIIDKENYRLMEATIYDKNGSTYSYVIKTFEPNINVDSSKFTFNKTEFPDAEIVDMR